MLKVSVIPIASGARLPARPATAVLSTTVTRKNASTASMMKPATGVIVSDTPARARSCASVGGAEAGGDTAEQGSRQERTSDASNELASNIANGVDRIDGASGEHADCDRRVHVPARHRTVCKGESHDGQTMGQSNRSHTGQADTIADHAAVPAPMNTNENVPMNSASRYGIDRSARSGLRQAKPGWLRDSRWRARAPPAMEASTLTPRPAPRPGPSLRYPCGSRRRCHSPGRRDRNARPDA
jgi:hypothetical protein